VKTEKRQTRPALFFLSIKSIVLPKSQSKSTAFLIQMLQILKSGTDAPPAAPAGAGTHQDAAKQTGS
jgi:hypothetical protein